MAERGDLAVPAACSLSAEGVTTQGARYAAVAAHVEALARPDGRVLASLGPDADLEAVDLLVEVERECCPFFEIGWDREARELSFAVADAGHRPALEAIAAALSSKGSAPH